MRTRHEDERHSPSRCVQCVNCWTYWRLLSLRGHRKEHSPHIHPTPWIALWSGSLLFSSRIDAILAPFMSSDSLLQHTGSLGDFFFSTNFHHGFFPPPCSSRHWRVLILQGLFQSTWKRDVLQGGKIDLTIPTYLIRPLWGIIIQRSPKHFVNIKFYTNT